MKKFSIRHVLLATTAICAFLGWAQLDRNWHAFRTVVAVDGEIVQTKNGPVSRLFYSSRVGFGYDGRAWIEVMRPPISKPTALGITSICLIISIAVMHLLREKQECFAFFAFVSLRLMCLSVLVYPTPAMLSWALDLF